jgi:hypothetical protein
MQRIAGYDLSTYLKNIDHFMDRSGLSCINNLVNCVVKACIGIYHFRYGNDALKNTYLNHYWHYIDNKDKLTCAFGLVPILGSVFIWLKEESAGEKRYLVQPLDEINNEPDEIYDNEEGYPDGIEIELNFETQEEQDRLL